MNIDKVAKAIEKDLGVHLPEIRQSLQEMKDKISAHTYSSEQLLVRAARQKLGLSQQAFANLIKTPVATLRDWEQGRFAPPGGIICLLEIAIKHPDVLQELAA